MEAWRQMCGCQSVSQLLLVNHTSENFKDTYLSAQGCPGCPEVGFFTKSLYPENFVRKSKRRTAEPRRNPTEKNKTTGNKRRVVLFFLLTAVPPAEASRPGTLILLRGGSRALRSFILPWHHTGEALPLVSCRASWEDRGAILCNLFHLFLLKTDGEMLKNLM